MTETETKQAEAEQEEAAETQTVVPPTVTTIGQAFTFLGLTGSVSSQDEIKKAFARRVKALANESGDGTGDMDNLTQAKEFY